MYSNQTTLKKKFTSEPGSAPRNVQVRPLSSSTMVIQWDEPETPNGQVTVSNNLYRIVHFGNKTTF